ncbi:MAG TPA: hypothetical protein ENG87_01070 [Candidatus Pacearchaeota archaeon]|nr:hypothetical protein BMS3Abin17_00391 [archaeon BMS3Abin17]HDK41942.1 hypothetical protein [Candidatus Pacearchaeota archaeon]HDZ60254.1 hypothetical protein [Candidatus Pacearchaeota archaeon]
MTHVPISYDIPIFVFIALALYTTYKLNKVRNYLLEGALKKSYFWLVVASIFFTLWAVSHLVSDFLGYGDLELILHYGISHGFLLISMLCIAISAQKIQGAYKELAGKLRAKKKK